MTVVAKITDNIIKKGQYYDIVDYDDNIIPYEKLILIPNSNNDSFVWYPMELFELLPVVIKRRIQYIKNKN